MFSRIIIRNLGFKRPTLRRSTATVSQSEAGMSSRHAYETLNTQMEKLDKRVYAFYGVFISGGIFNYLLDKSIERKLNDKLEEMKGEMKGEIKEIHIKLASQDVKLASLDGNMKTLLAILSGKGEGGSTVA